MVHAGRMSRALCLLCLALLLLLAQDVHSRKLLLQEKLSHGHGAGTTTTQEPYREEGGSTGGSDNGQVQLDSAAKWAEIHTDYIYTQDVNNP
ncbi:hypothetical protein ABZP36_020800 [Zizania latifolia]